MVKRKQKATELTNRMIQRHICDKEVNQSVLIKKIAKHYH